MIITLNNGQTVDTKTFTANDFYNCEELNRIESNLSKIAAFARTYGLNIGTSAAVTTRTELDFEFFDSFNRIENDFNVIKNAMSQPNGWIEPKTTWASLHAFGYEDANRLERNIESLAEMANKVTAAYRRCGSLNCNAGVL